MHIAWRHVAIFQIAPIKPRRKRIIAHLKSRARRMRADELRDCLVREIARSMAIELQVQAALFDCDDALAIENLRRHWRVMRADVSPDGGRAG